MSLSSTDPLTDSLDREWTAGALLGRGSWGRTRVIRDATGREAVLKEPLTDDDFPADAPLPADRVAACRAAAHEQAELLDGAPWPWLPRLEATVDLGGGRIGLVMPRYTTLEHRIEANQLPLIDALKVVIVVARRLAEAGVSHGNLRPTNILVNERGDPVLADSATPAMSTHGVRLLELAGERGWLPPEAVGSPAPRWDTWALAQVLHTAAMTRSTTSDDGRVQRPGLPSDGLDKLALATLKDRALARLSTEGSNPRFRSRLAERLAALLNRALSADRDPSPPYRFAETGELAERADEIMALVRPAVQDVGRLLLPAEAPEGVFRGGQPVAFTVSVGCTQGVDDHEDLVCGLQIVDLDAEADGRVSLDEARFDVERHPSGRLRYKFGVPQLGPGRYQVKAAFSIKDSGDPPRSALGEIEVRPPPGYVPPSQPVPDAPIRLDAARPSVPSDPAAPSSPVAPRAGLATDASDPGAEVIEGVFPRPIAPPDNDDPEPLSAPLAPEALAAPCAPRPGPVAVPTADPSSAEGDPTSAGAQTAQPVSAAAAPASVSQTPVSQTPVSPTPASPTPVSPPSAPAPPPPVVDADPPSSGPATATVAGSPPPPPPVTTATIDDPSERDFFGADLGLEEVEWGPGSGEDLPTRRGDTAGGGLPEPIQRILDTVGWDSYIAVGVAVAASLILVLALTALLKAC